MNVEILADLQLLSGGRLLRRTEFDLEYAKSRKIHGLDRKNLKLQNRKTTIWPMPTRTAHGNATLALHPAFQFFASEGGALDPLLVAATQRYRSLLFEGTEDGIMRDKVAHGGFQMLWALEIQVEFPNVTLHVGMDESYSLNVPFEDTGAAKLQAKTLYGALRGLETFSQLCQYDYLAHAFVIKLAPWIVTDKPRFVHRGLLLDTARHYEPVIVIERLLDSMSYAKLNVLHWHMVDEQSFPIEVPSFPLLWKGAYSTRERYSMADIARIVKYAAARGIVVEPEIDVPGHAASWGIGYPYLWPSKACRMPLDVSKNSTFDVIEGILKDLKSVVPYPVIHLGGDEVSTDCWVLDKRVNAWMEERGFSPVDAYEYFVQRARRIALEVGWEKVVLWEETFQNFGQNLDKSVIVQNWLNREVTDAVVSVGLKLIHSVVPEWYLDHSENDWWDAYQLEPCSYVKDENQCDNIIGGEACMWSEHVDPSNLLMRVWPRTAAVAERLWTRASFTRNATRNGTSSRLSSFRCLLHRRGISANYVNLPAWDSPFEPSSCYNTR